MASSPNWTRGRVLGRGSSATVSLAIDLSSGETFAVKSSELSMSAFLQREQRFLSSISSPHVISYLGFDVTSEGGRSMYNMFVEYAAGGSVADEIQRRGGGGLEEWKIQSYTRGILMGLSYLHSVGIAHCDVKGKNVLVGSDGAAKIADLGCAKWDSDIDRRSFRGGTPAFMPPEVARGEEQRMAVDIWALGCTVIEMTTGKLPWPGLDSPMAVVHRIGFSEEVPEIPKWMSNDGGDFLEKCLRRNPEERWTADELLRHPFVSESCPKDPTWKSPKCVLDQDIWDSMEEEEIEEVVVEEEQSAGTTSDPVNRIRQLIGGSCGISGSTWDDDSWITVRGGDNDNESSSSATAADNVTEEPSSFSDYGESSGVGEGKAEGDSERSKLVVDEKDHYPKRSCSTPCCCLSSCIYSGFSVNDMNCCCLC